MTTHFHVSVNRTPGEASYNSAEDADVAARDAAARLISDLAAGGQNAEAVPFGHGLMVTWRDEYLSGWQSIETTACAQSHRSAAQSPAQSPAPGRPPLTVRAEVWPLSADSEGIHLISGADAWRSRAIPGDTDPHWTVQQILRRHGALGAARVVHSTSWRCEGTSVILTYVAALDCPHVDQHWPDAELVSLMLPDAVGRPLRHAAAEPPTPRYVDVLLHALRHLRFLEEHDADAREAFSPAWRRHLAAFAPALAGMYTGDHEPEILPQAV